jgi:hypothetical protein
MTLFCLVFELSPLLEKSCTEHNLKALGDNLFKLPTVVEGIGVECSAKNYNYILPHF